MNEVATFDRVVGVGVDWQNDFSETGALPVGLEDHAGNASIAPFNKSVRWVRNQNGMMVWSEDEHPPVTNHFDVFGAHCVVGTFGQELVSELDTRPEDLIVKKGTKVDEDAFSAFQGVADDGRTLEQVLTPKPRERVAAIFGGWATEYCIDASVMNGLELADRVNRIRDGRRLGIFVVRDAIAAVDNTSGAAAIERMQAAGATFITSEELVNGQVIQIA